MATLNPELSKEIRRLMRTNLKVNNDADIERDEEVIALSIKYNHYLPDLASRIGSVRRVNKRAKDAKAGQRQ